MKTKWLVLILGLILLSAGTANANTIRAAVSPEPAPGYISVGEPFTVDIYMNNTDGLVLGYSLPLAFYSPDGPLPIIHRNVGGLGPYGSITMAPDYTAYWIVLNQWTGFSFDGNLADTINHTTASLTGWPEGLGEQLNIQFAMQIDQVGTFCVDSVSIPDQEPPGKFDWLFDFPTTFGGPYCWQVVYYVDTDGDGIMDFEDNCPAEYNPGQEDDDGDGQGNACDNCPNDPENDADGDGVCGDVDNCPTTFNPSQADNDGDGMGNECDACPNDPDNDIDGDGVCGDIDNCPAYNPDQADADGDDVGDICDNCPDVYNPGQEDSDANGVGDACETMNRVWYVMADGSGDAPTIQAAVDSCINGDTVLAADGIFVGEGNYNIDFSGKIIVVMSENGPENTIIDCEGSHDETSRRGFIFRNEEGAESILNGFAIKNGMGVSDSEISGDAAGALVVLNASPTIMNCVFMNNEAWPSSGISNGGAMYCYINGSMTMRGCRFVGNKATFGGAIEVGAGSLILENCEFIGNIADNGPGGAINSNGSHVSAEDCFFTANLAGAGSAIYSDQSSIVINNSTLALNGQDTLLAENSVIFCFNGTSLTMNRSIVAFNSQCRAVWCENMDVNDIQINCSDIYGNDNGDWVDCLAGMDEINNNFASDPQFCDTANGNLHIAHMSPCSPSLSLCGQLVGAFGIGCGLNRVMIEPATMYVFYANDIGSQTAAVYLSDLGGGYTVNDIDQGSIFINDVITPFGFEIIPASDDASEMLKMNCSLSEFVEYYGPQWDTTIQEFSLAWLYNDEAVSSATGVFKMIGHRSGDVNIDGKVNMEDVIYLIKYLYRRGAEPLPVPAAGDVNTTGTVNLKDVTYLIDYLYKGGPAPTGPLMDSEY